MYCKITSQYRGCGYPGSFCLHVINSHGINSWHAGTELFRFNNIVNITVADALAPCVASASATVILTMLSRWDLILHEGKFQLCALIVEEWYKLWIHVHVSSENLGRKGLINYEEYIDQRAPWGGISTTSAISVLRNDWKRKYILYFLGKIELDRRSLHWRHNDHDGVSNHQPHGCLLNRLFRRRSKKTSKLRVTGLCVGNSPVPVNSPHKGPVTRKMFPFDDVIM